MRQRVGNNFIYISPIFTIFFTDEYRKFSPLFKIHDFVSEALIFPLFTLVFRLVKLLVLVFISQVILILLIFLVKKGTSDDEAFVWDRGH